MKSPLAFAFAVAAVLALPAAADARVTTLHTTYVNTSIRLFGNAAAPGGSPVTGDRAVIRSRYSSGGRVIGFERTACTVVDWPHAVCSINLAFRGGHLIVSDQLSVTSRATQHLAIVGGTGAYRGARGDYAIKQSSETRGTAVLTIIT